MSGGILIDLNMDGVSVTVLLGVVGWAMVHAMGAREVEAGALAGAFCAISQ